MSKDDLMAQPTALAIMERVQQVETRLGAEIEGVETRLRTEIGGVETRLTKEIEGLSTHMLALRDEMSGCRDDVNKSLKLLGNKIEVLNEDILSVRGSQREIIKQMRELEPKA